MILIILIINISGSEIYSLEMSTIEGLRQKWLENQLVFDVKKKVKL